MTDVTIRPSDERDYPAMLAISLAIYPEYPWSEAEWREEDSRYDGKPHVLRRIVAALPDGQVIGMAEYKHMPSMYHPQKFWLEVDVHPEFQDRGIGRRLYKTLMTGLASHEPLVLWGGVRETSGRGIRFATALGFKEVRRVWEFRLDLAAFDPAPFEAKAASALSDFTIVSVAEEQGRDSTWLQRVYDLHIEVDGDVPRPDAYTPRPLEDYERHLFKHPDYLPEGHFLVRDGDRYVAETFLMTSQELPDVLYQGLTGTRRAFRGRGLALALKLRTIAYARKRGTREIRTWNDSMNAPMVHINRKLGFRPQPAWITFEKRLTEQ